MILWDTFKSEARRRMWPAGEPSNLIAAHDKSFVDAVVDLQQWISCLQLDNTTIVQQCETFFNCGITAFDSPRGNILKLSVIDKINQTTGREDATQPDDYCSDIVYLQIDPCYIHKYISTARSTGCCGDIGAFFAIPTCGKNRFPPPTDVGLNGLPPLALGYHYAQTSTDARRRAGGGVWAIERGKIYVAPWIQSTETIILKWDGIKRSWSNNDQLDDDPLLAKAIENYVLAEHAAKWDHDYAAEASYMAKFSEARAVLMRQCEEENRVRNCETSKARSSVASLPNLFYNDTAASFTAQCPDGTDGTPATATIAVGSVASNDSVADANQKAQQQAQAQAIASLNCVDESAVFTNDDQPATANCIGESGAPTPTGASKTVTVVAGSVTAATKGEANALAYAQALAAATAQLTCVWHNAPQTALAVCASDATKNKSYTVPSGQPQFDSDLSQDDADNSAMIEAQNQANILLSTSGCAESTIFWNTIQQASAARSCPYFGSVSNGSGGVVFQQIPCNINVIVKVAAHFFSSSGATASLIDANNTARNYAQALANATANARCQQRACGTQIINIPP